MSVDNGSKQIPSGPACAAILASGIGVCLLGIMVVLCEASSNVAQILTLLKPVGPLSGKVAVGIVGWLVSWGLLQKLWGKRQMNVAKVQWMATLLIVAGFALTFPPVFQLFAH